MAIKASPMGCLRADATSDIPNDRWASDTNRRDSGGFLIIDSDVLDKLKKHVLQSQLPEDLQMNHRAQLAHKELIDTYLSVIELAREALIARKRIIIA